MLAIQVTSNTFSLCLDVQSNEKEKNREKGSKEERNNKREVESKFCMVCMNRNREEDE
jgi:hypothetical protein